MSIQSATNSVVKQLKINFNQAGEIDGFPIK